MQHRKLKELREKAGLSFYALARESGVHRQSIANYESGRNEPPAENLYRIAEALSRHIPGSKLQALLAELSKPTEYGETVTT